MNRIIIHIAVCLALILFIAAIDALVASAATTFPACTAGETTETVSFVHIGDLHANFDLVEDKYTKIRNYLDQARSANPYTLFTNAGDDHEKGSIAEQYSHGDAAMEATFAMQFDVRTIGNHDFAWGGDHLLAFSHDPYGIVLASNTTYTVDPSAFGAVPYAELQVGCVKIGFFGMVGSSWNELDEQTYDDYLPGFDSVLGWSSVYSSLAQDIVDAHRNDVDLMVMVSHLGNPVDKYIATNTTGIDLILGGHSHQTPTEAYITNPYWTGSTLVVLPDFYGDGITQVDATFDLVSHAVSTLSYQEVPVAGLTSDPTSTIHEAISSIIDQYAPDAQTPIAYLQNEQDNDGNDTTNTPFATIAAKAAVEQYPVDAALLDPARADPWGNWPAGPVTTQELLDGYYIERQPSDTPGINALYMVEVSGEDLQLMTAQTPTWVYAGPTPVTGATYKVILHKGAALDPDVFFPGVSFSNVSFVSETFETLAEYGANRTNGCLYLDTDVKLSASPCNFQLIDGACGTASGSSFPSAPAGKLCGAGIASTISGSGPWTWSCSGLNGGSTANCSANKMIIGVCGSSNGGNFTSAPTTNLCTAGTASTVGGSGPWYWDCAGSNGGSTAACLAYIIIDGECGTANGSIFTSAPTTSLCSAGNASTITGGGPWYWDCTGSNGGITANCSANIQTYTVTPTAGSGGSISPNTPQVVNYNGTTSFTITPSTGYGISSVTGCSSSLTGSSYTTGPITADCTITASFALNDTTPPIVTISIPPDNSFTNSPSLVVSGNASDNVGVTSVLVNGSSVTLNPDTSFSQQMTLQAGVNTITIIASDAAGNRTTITRTVTYDGSAPNIAVSSPVQNSITSSDTVLVDGTASDGLTTVSVVISDGTNTFIPTAVSGSFEQQITFPSEGQYIITATATDQAGNSSSVTRTISYIRLGDLDSSGEVSAEDALRALRIASGLIQPTNTDLLRGDVAPLVSGMPQPDGKIDIGDVIVILRKAVGLPSW